MEESRKDTPIIPPDLALLSTVIGSNYPCLELIFMVPKVFEPLKFYCIYDLKSADYTVCIIIITYYKHCEIKRHFNCILRIQNIIIKLNPVSLMIL